MFTILIWAIFPIIVLAQNMGVISENIDTIYLSYKSKLNNETKNNDQATIYLNDPAIVDMSTCKKITISNSSKYIDVKISQNYLINDIINKLDKDQKTYFDIRLKDNVAFFYDGDTDYKLIDYQIIELNNDQQAISEVIYYKTKPNEEKISTFHAKLNSVDIKPNANKGAIISPTTINTGDNSFRFFWLNEAKMSVMLTSSKDGANQQQRIMIKLSSQFKSEVVERTKLITSIPNDKQIDNFHIVYLGLYNQNDRQFLVYQEGTNIVYLIINKDGLNKSSSLIKDEMVIPFEDGATLHRISYHLNRILIITTKKDSDNEVEEEFTNSYTTSLAGEPFKLEQLKVENLQSLTKGRFLCAYYNPQNNVPLIDFLINDDNDEIQGDEVLITTYYYSQSTNRLEVYSEELTVNKDRKEMQKDIKVLISRDYIFHTFSVYNRVKGTKITYLSIQSRYHGESEKRIYLGRGTKIIYSKVFFESNLIILKLSSGEYDSRTLQYIPQEPAIHINLTENIYAQGDDKSSLKDQITIEIVGEECFTFPSSTDSTSELKRITYNLKVNLTESYFEKTKPKAIKRLPIGVNFKMLQNELISGNFLEIWNRESSIIGDKKYNDLFDYVDNYFIRENANMKHRLYKITLQKNEIGESGKSLPVFFELKKQTEFVRSLVLDLKTKTKIYKANDSVFKFHADAPDSRKISHVSMLDTQDALVNISKNIFSLNIDTLEDKPLTGIGSFCIAMIRVRLGEIPEIFICFGKESIQAHYVEQRYLAAQTQLKINYDKNKMDQLLKDYKLEEILYSLSKPDMIVMALSTPTSNPKEKEIIDKKSYRIRFLRLSFASTLNLEIIDSENLEPSYKIELQNLRQSIDNETPNPQLFLLDNHLVFLIQEGTAAKWNTTFLVYEIQYNKEWRRNDQNGESLPNNHNSLVYSSKITLIKSKNVTMQEYLVDKDPSIEKEFTIEKVEVVNLVQNYPPYRSFNKEPIYTSKLILLVKTKVDKSKIPKLKNLKKDVLENLRHTFFNVVLFEHATPKILTFFPIVNSFYFEKIYIGPAFISKENYIERSLVIMGKPYKKKKTAQDSIDRQDNEDNENEDYEIYVLDTIDPVILFRLIENTEGIVEENSKYIVPKITSLNTFSYYNMKDAFSHYLQTVIQIEEAKKTKTTDTKPEATTAMDDKYILTKIEITPEYQNKYLNFTNHSSLTQIANEIDLRVNKSWIELFSNTHLKAYNTRVENYFSGHIFRTEINCESHIENRDNIIERTSQVRSKKSLFKANSNSLNKVTIGYSLYPDSWAASPNNPDKIEFISVLTDTQEYTNQTIEGDFSVIESNIEKLVTGCSEFGIYLRYAVIMCSNKANDKNYLRVFNMPGMVWFDIAIDFESGRIFSTSHMKVYVIEDYIVFFSYNYVYERYHTALVFRMLDNYNSNFKNETVHDLVNIKDNITSYTILGQDNKNDKQFKVFTNRELNQSFYACRLIEIPMNEEHINITFKRETIPGESMKETLFFTGYIRSSVNQIRLYFNTYTFLYTLHNTQGEKGLSEISIKSQKKICDEKLLNIKFDITKEQDNILDEAKIISMPIPSEKNSLKDDIDEPCFEFILHFPNAHDFLIRFRLKEIGESSLNRENEITGDKVYIMPISNPFYGIRVNDIDSPTPIFTNGIYLVLSNYDDDIAYLRAYELTPEKKRKAKQRTKSIELLTFGKWRPEPLDPVEFQLSICFTFMAEKLSGTYHVMKQLKFPKELSNIKDDNIDLKGIKFLLLNHRKEVEMIEFSPYITLKSSSKYLASTFVKLTSQGPFSKQGNEIKIISNEIGLEGILLSAGQIVVLFLLSGLVVGLVLICRRTPSNLPPRPDLINTEIEKRRKSSGRLVDSNEDFGDDSDEEIINSEARFVSSDPVSPEIKASNNVVIDESTIILRNKNTDNDNDVVNSSRRHERGSFENESQLFDTNFMDVDFEKISSDDKGMGVPTQQIDSEDEN